MAGQNKQIGVCLLPPMGYEAAKDDQMPYAEGRRPGLELLT